MGIDALDIIFRLEQAFDVKIMRGRVYSSEEVNSGFKSPAGDVTVGEIHQRICDLLREMKLPVPQDSWRRVTQCIGDALKILFRFVACPGRRSSRCNLFPTCPARQTDISYCRSS